MLGARNDLGRGCFAQFNFKFKALDSERQALGLPISRRTIGIGDAVYLPRSVAFAEV